MPPRRQRQTTRVLPNIPEEQEQALQESQEEDLQMLQNPLSQEQNMQSPRQTMQQGSQNQDISNRLQEVQQSLNSLVTAMQDFTTSINGRQARQNARPQTRSQEEEQNIDFLEREAINYRMNPLYRADNQEENRSLSLEDAETRPRTRNSTTIVMAPKIIPYDGDENPESWLRIFKRCMQRQGTHENEYLEELPYWLKGKALNWFELNEESFKRKFSNFQIKFLRKYYKDPDIYESKLLTTKQRNNQSLEDYLSYLQKLAKPAKIPEQKIKVAFIEGLKEKDIRRHARQSFLFQNNQYDLDRVLFSLQEYEYDSRVYTNRFENRDKDKDKPSFAKGAVNKDQKQDFKKKKVNLVDATDPNDQVNEVVPDTDDEESSQDGDNILGDVNLVEGEDYPSQPIFLETDDKQAFSPKDKSTTLDIVNNVQSKNLHKQLVDKIKKAKYIPAKSAKSFAEGTLANMSLAQVMEVSPSVSKDWIKYGQTCLQNMENKDKKQIEQSNQEIQDYLSNNEANLIMENQSIPVLKDVAFDYLPCTIFGLDIKGMLDTGANVCLVSEDFLKKNNLTNKVVKSNKSIGLGDGNRQPIVGILKEVPISLDKTFNVITDLLVTQAKNYELLFGRNLQRTLNMIIYQNKISYVHPFSKQEKQVEFCANTVQLQTTPQRQEEKDERIDLQDFSVLLANKTSENLTTKIKQSLYPNFPMDKKYQLLLIDPPWQYDINTIPSLKPFYQTLSIGQLQSLPVKQISEKDSILLLWTTGPMLNQAISLIQEYGFTYKTVLFTWIKTDNNNKTILGKGNYTAPCTELLLLATKGRTKDLFKKDEQVSQLIQASIVRHSQKPDQIYDLLNKLIQIPKMKNIEIFARNRQKFFESYGNELSSQKPQVNMVNCFKAIKNSSTQIWKNLRNDKNLDEIWPIDIAIEDKQDLGIQLKYFEENKLNHDYNACLNMVEVLPETQQAINEIPLGIQDGNEIQQVKQLLQKYSKQFASTLEELGSSNIGEHVIKLKPGYKPNQQTPYRLSKPESEFVAQEVEDLIKQGFIKEDVGEWASPILVVKKANGKYRMCVDYRKLNTETLDEKFPIPRIDDIFAQLQGKKYFTKLDLKSGFWQINIAKESQQYTGFVTPQGQFYWVRMPFGLKNAPSTFQRCMQKVFQKALRTFVMVYIDDIIIFSNSFEEHLQHLEWVLRRLQEVNFKLGPDKCTLFQQSLDILGHTISYNKIQPMKHKVVAIEKILPPQNKTDVRSFLGLTGYYRQFIPNFSKIAQPLYKISGETQQWEWSDKQTQAFQMLKLALMENPILHLCVDDKPFTLYTDFSYQGLGAVLTQHVNPKKEMVIEFASRTLYVYERNLDPYQGEVLAVYWALTYFRHYLLGREFTLVTDNKALEWVMKLSNPSRKINRWLIDIMEYTFTVKHRKGTTHNNADALSRLATDPKTEEQAKFVQDIGDISCKICSQTEPKNTMLLCDYCGDAMHTTCVNLNQIPIGPFYCIKCLKEIQTQDKKDITVDFNVIEYLKNETLPENSVEQNRVLRRASNYILRDERIYYMSKKGLRLIPTISERPQLVQERHSIAGHQSVFKTVKLIQQDYVWANLYKDVIREIKNCTICNATNPKFSLSENYYPTEKGSSPFEIVAIDLITNLPTTKKGNKHVIVAIDAFSKFVELAAIPSRHSVYIRDFLIKRILCHHGCPSMLRSDKGKEFLGAVSSLLEQYNILHKQITKGYPEANAQAERTVQTVERILRRYLLDNNVPTDWDDILPYIERSINSTVSKSTKITPHECLYGKAIRLPDSVQIHLQNYQEELIQDKQVEKYSQNLKGLLQQTHKKALKALEEEDERQKNARKQNTKQKEIKFEPGQLVYVRRIRSNKLDAPVFGPFQFIQYHKKGVVTLFDQKEKKTFQQNANQLALTQQLPN